MRRWLCLALVSVATVALAGGGAEAAPAIAAAPGRIVFTSNRDGDYELYAVNLDGSALTQLTHNTVEDSSPLPSPDGKLIAFLSEDGGTVVMNADGSARHKVAGCGLFPRGWSPDSTRLLCEGSNEEGLSVADLKDGTVTPIRSTGVAAAAWSPDGSMIAFVDQNRLWVVAASGGVSRRIERRDVGYEPPSWSPDSKRLTYTGSTGDLYGLFTIGADGSGERQLVKDILGGAQWSPQGSLIAFTKPFRHRYNAIYTVHSDGTGLRRITASTGGEMSDAASWSGDGTSLIYIRYRFKNSQEADVFVTRPGAGSGRPVTRPFPAGGTNEEPRWMVGPPLTTPPGPRPRTLALPRGRTMTLTTSFDSIATDGNRAVAYRDSCGGVVVWSPLVGRTAHTPRICPPDGAWHLGTLVLAGRRLAAILGRGSASGDHEALSTLALGDRGSRVVIETIESNDNSAGSASIDHLRGRGGTIAFTSRDYSGQTETRRSWLLVTRGGRRCPWGDPSDDFTSKAVCRRLPGVDGGITAAVDAGRVLTVAPGGIVRILSTRGSVLRQWTLGPGIDEATLRGRRLALQRGASLSLYDTATGAKRETRQLVSDEGPPYLLDVQGNLATYVTSGAVHLLRLSDGLDLALALPRAAPPLDARLEPKGLFVLWNRMYDRRPGRLAFVSLGALAQAVGR